jgi:DNA-binding NarL/FixJ family response regulator
MKSELFLSLQTVKNHVSRIYGKMGVRNRIELVNKIRNAGRR